MGNNRLLYSEFENIVILRVEGKGTWVESKTFLEFCEKIPENKKIVVDLSSCKILDSTFLGSLAYLSIKRNGLEIFKPGPEVRRAMKTLGLCKILHEVKIPEKMDVVKEIINKKNLSASDAAKTILLAHKALLKVAPMNSPKFSDLIEIMEKEVGKE